MEPHTYVLATMHATPILQTQSPVGADHCGISGKPIVVTLLPDLSPCLQMQRVVWLPQRTAGMFLGAAWGRPASPVADMGTASTGKQGPLTSCPKVQRRTVTCRLTRGTEVCGGAHVSPPMQQKYPGSSSQQGAGSKSAGLTRFGSAEVGLMGPNVDLMPAIIKWDIGGLSAWHE
jgi:hypothetical protein